MGCDDNDGPSDGEAERDRQNRESETTGTSALGTLGSDDVDSRTDQYLTIRPTGDGVATFEATVDGRIKSADDLDAIIPGLGKSAEDAVANEPKQYILNGRLADLRIDGPAAAFLDGERVA